MFGDGGGVPTARRLIFCAADEVPLHQRRRQLQHAGDVVEPVARIVRAAAATTTSTSRSSRSRIALRYSVRFSRWSGSVRPGFGLRGRSAIELALEPRRRTPSCVALSGRGDAGRRHHARRASSARPFPRLPASAPTLARSSVVERDRARCRAPSCACGVARQAVALECGAVRGDRRWSGRLHGGCRRRGPVHRHGRNPGAEAGADQALPGEDSHAPMLNSGALDSEPIPGPDYPIEGLYSPRATPPACARRAPSSAHFRQRGFLCAHS